MPYDKHNWVNGELINADKLNHMEQGIEDAMSSGGGDTAVYLDATLAVGATSVTFTDSRITGNSLLDVYTSMAGLAYEEMTATTGSVTVTFEAQETAVQVTLEIKERS